MNDFSVLLSVYEKETPDNLNESLKSVFNQSYIPNEVVLVEDGVLTKELYSVINFYKNNYPSILNVISLENNCGLGTALSIGLKHCQNKLVARMDTDDIAKPNRFEKQLEIFKNNSDIDIVGSWVEEFEKNISNVISIKKVPQTNKQIKEFAKSRNPFNHPTVMFKKKSVLEAGNYIEFYLNEDYFLWLRMLNKGFKAYNIQESLLYFRVNKDTFKRRGGIKYAIQDIKLQNKLLGMKFINEYEYLRNVIIKPIVRLLPNFIREYIYKKLLR